MPTTKSESWGITEIPDELNTRQSRARISISRQRWRRNESFQIQRETQKVGEMLPNPHDLLQGEFPTLNPFPRFVRARFHYRNLKREGYDFCTRNYINHFKTNPASLYFYFVCEIFIYFILQLCRSSSQRSEIPRRFELHFSQFKGHMGRDGVARNGQRPTAS